MANKYLSLDGLKVYNQAVLVDQINEFVKYDTTNHKFVKTSFANGSGDDVGKVIKTTADLAIIDSTVTPESSNLVTSGAVAAAISGITGAMVYMGTLGTSPATIQALPLDGTAKVGATYKVATADTYTIATGETQAAKVGDLFICLTQTASANTWTYVPTGDDVDVTAITIGDGLSVTLPSGQTGSTITTTGTIALSAASDTTLGGVTIASTSAISNTDGAVDVKIDGSTVTKNASNQLTVPTASSTLGLVKDGERVTIAADGTISADLATASTAGAVKPDGTIITLDTTTGAITVPKASNDGTTTTLGVVAPDNTSITTNANGVLTVDTIITSEINALFTTGA